jgi:plastocyanin
MATTNVTIKNFAYTPKEIEITQGDKVVWTSEDAVEHTVTADNGDFDSGDIAKDDPPFEQTFDTVTAAGAPIRYHCDHHGSMKGSITVIAAKPAGKPAE